ncbi:RNA polymerase sigma factor [Algirhabdus cladophorae]|uniref:RNA polymerase sigma factor n=1 Tax=Algirhabdus cladophorae TaxID=3377108 RepID=UPI003B848029
MTMPYDAMSQTSDDALLVLYANGDAAAAGALTARLTPRIFGYAARVLGDRAEAEDVTQEAMIRLWKQAPTWRQGEAKVSTWLYRVAVNLCTDRLRKKRGLGLDEIAEPVSQAASADAKLIADDRAAALQAALGTLPDAQRQAVVLRHIEGHSNPDIAQIMEISVEAVESLTARGKRGLTAALSGQKEALGFENDPS